MNQQKRKMATLIAVLVVGGGLVGLAAHAPEPNGAETNTAQTSSSFFDDPNFADKPGLGFDNGHFFLKMMGSVLLVMALAGAVLYVSKKVLPKVAHTAGKEIHILETAYLGPRKALHLVEIGSQKLLIGSTNENIATLAHLGDAWLDLAKQETDQTVSD